LLSDLGYKILTASDGVEARRVLQSNGPIDLLLSDVVMPNGVSGIDLAEDARRLRQDLKVVLVSGYSRGLKVPSRGVRPFIFLEKPFRQAELAASIAAALNGAGD
jgi:CheY-like chemotaxis protein